MDVIAAVHSTLATATGNHHVCAGILADAAQIKVGATVGGYRRIIAGRVAMAVDCAWHIGSASDIGRFAGLFTNAVDVARACWTVAILTDCVSEKKE